MTAWNEIKRPFREALIQGFNWNSLAIVLQYHTDMRLDRITSSKEPFDKNVDDVIDNAVRNGWLEQLARGALAENKLHAGLNAVVPVILEGITAEGRAYYQGDVFDGSQNGNKSEPEGRSSAAGQVPDILELHQQLVDHFSLQELNTFCNLYLKVDFDDLGGSTKSAKARELVLYMERRGKLDRLSDEIQKEIERRKD